MSSANFYKNLTEEVAMPQPIFIPELIDRLIEERTRLLAAVADLSEAEATRPLPTSEGGWSVKDVLAHVTISEAANLAFAKRMVAEDNPVQMLPDKGPFDLDRWNNSQVRRRQQLTWAQVQADLAAAHKETLAFVAGLEEAQLDRRGVQAVFGEITLGQLLKILYRHDRMHREEIEQGLAATGAGAG
jgi:uncharacterized damage-inducible protein DinB